MTSPSHDRRALLALIWLFAILNMVFRDIHELTMASTLNDILSGTVNGTQMSKTVLLYGAFAVELLLLGFLLSAVLLPRHARMLNLVLPPIAVAGMAIVPPADPDDYFFATVVLGAFCAIFTLAWRWKVPAKPRDVAGGYHAA